MSTHPLYVHDDMNMISMVGKNGVSRIDLSQPPDKLVWKSYKGNFGYNERIDYSKTPHNYNQTCREG